MQYQIKWFVIAALAAMAGETPDSLPQPAVPFCYTGLSAVLAFPLCWPFCCASISAMPAFSLHWKFTVLAFQWHWPFCYTSLSETPSPLLALGRFCGLYVSKLHYVVYTSNMPFCPSKIFMLFIHCLSAQKVSSENFYTHNNTIEYHMKVCKFNKTYRNTSSIFI